MVCRDMLRLIRMAVLISQRSNASKCLDKARFQDRLYSAASRAKQLCHSGYLTRECFTPLYIIKEIPLKMTINSITLCIPSHKGEQKILPS